MLAHLETLNFDQGSYNFFVGVIMPLVVAFLVKVDAPSWFKGAVNLVATSAAGVITTVISHGGLVSTKEFVFGVAVALLTSWSSYQSAWKPLQVPQKIASAVPAGVGPSSTHKHGTA